MGSKVSTVTGVSTGTGVSKDSETSSGIGVSTCTEVSTGTGVSTGVGVSINTGIPTGVRVLSIPPPDVGPKNELGRLEPPEEGTYPTVRGSPISPEVTMGISVLLTSFLKGLRPYYTKD